MHVFPSSIIKVRCETVTQLNVSTVIFVRLQRLQIHALVVSWLHCMPEFGGVFGVAL